MTVDVNIRGEKLQYNNNRQAENISALSSGKIDKEQRKNKLKQLKSMENNQLNLIHLLKKNNKVQHLLSKNKYFISLQGKELEKFENYIIVLILKIWYMILRVPVKI